MPRLNNHLPYSLKNIIAPEVPANENAVMLFPYHSENTIIPSHLKFFHSQYDEPSFLTSCLEQAYYQANLLWCATSVSMSFREYICEAGFP